MQHDYVIQHNVCFRVTEEDGVIMTRPITKSSTMKMHLGACGGRYARATPAHLYQVKVSQDKAFCTLCFSKQDIEAIRAVFEEVSE